MNFNEDIMTTFNELNAKAVAALTEAEGLIKAQAPQEEVDAKITEAEGFETRAASAKKIEERKAALATPQRPPLPTGDPVPDMKSAVNEGGEPDPTAPFREAAYVLRFGTGDVPNEPAVKSVLNDLYGKDYEQKRYDQQRGFNTYLRVGDRGLDYKAAQLLKTPLVTPAEAKALVLMGLDVPEMKSTMVESIGNLGGYVVPGDFSANVIQRLPGMTVVRGNADTLQTSRDMITLPVDKGGNDQYTSNIRETWVSETPASSASETNLLFSMKDIPIHTAMGSVPISKNLVEDAAFDIPAHLVNKFAEAAAINEDNTFLTGDGVGKPQGILPGGANTHSISEVISGHATLLNDFDALVAMTFELAPQYLANAKWIGERATFKAIAQLVDSDGAYHWRETRGDNVTGQKRVLLGHDVLMQESLPTIGANTYPLLFGDLGAYTLIDRIGMTVERYDDSTTAKTNSVEYVMRRRLGGQLLQPYRFVVLKISA